MKRKRIRAEVEGIVQGVGFRPFIFQLADRFDLAGFVRNTSSGALLEVEGNPDSTTAFFTAMHNEAPPLAVITRVAKSIVPPAYESGFNIQHSKSRIDKKALISPDVSVCPDCLAELFNPNDRRHLYPFINCTNCGPRYTIIKDVPYDREKTSMCVFKMCEKCQAEYTDPTNRRFHAQPNACPDCGPKMTLLDSAGSDVMTDDPVQEASRLLKQGKIIVVKGLGGFHLAVDAANEASVAILRQRKQREEKPLAVMSPNLAAIRKFASLYENEEKILLSPQRPIVLLKALKPSPLALNVAPDNKYIGVMLPYTPLHYILIKDFLALVMTSGNLSEEPIAINNTEAIERLGGIADYFLVHNRDIYLRADDSVVRASSGKTRQIRRSRGYVPAPVFLKNNLPSVLAVGGELKNTICLTKENRAFVSQHIGDLENMKALSFFEMTIEHLKRILDVNPLCIAHDLHPEYLSSKWAMDQKNENLVGVQHHHAHVVGAMAEHGLTGPVIGLACDGTGYGEDGAVWGGELLLSGYTWYERRGRLEYVALPGGAAAIKEPWKMAVSYLHHAFGDQALEIKIPMTARQDQIKLNLLRQVISRKINSPLTSSLGRLFDAVAALIGLRDVVSFEGQAAMMLEMCCPDYKCDPYEVHIVDENGLRILRTNNIIEQIIRDIKNNRPAYEISGRFHATVIKGLARMASNLSADTGIKQVVLSGGCFQNNIIVHGVSRELEAVGLDVYTQNLLPVNDGGLSLGQAVCAGHIIAGLKD